MEENKTNNINMLNSPQYIWSDLRDILLYSVLLTTAHKEHWCSVLLDKVQEQHRYTNKGLEKTTMIVKSK